MANMARKVTRGVYQIGIYEVARDGRAWNARAVGPGTIGTGFVGKFASLAAAHLGLTGESMREAQR